MCCEGGWRRDADTADVDKELPQPNNVRSKDDRFVVQPREDDVMV